MDVAKAVSCLVNSPGSILDYYGDPNLKFTRSVTLICIPTTAGTGSEVTNVGVFSNKETHAKVPMVKDEFWPDYSLLDYQLTYTLPPAVTASTGMDAFTHAIEAYWNKNANPICDILAKDAMKLILNNIKTAYSQPECQEARANMMFASLIAGIAFSQTRTTGIHALSFPLTTNFGASHGIACAVTAPAFIRASKEKEYKKMEALANYLGFEGIDQFADGVENLMRSINLPVRLSELGVTEADIPSIVKEGMGAPIINLSPITVTEQSVEQLLRSIL